MDFIKLIRSFMLNDKLVCPKKLLIGLALSINGANEIYEIDPSIHSAVSSCSDSFSNELEPMDIKVKTAAITNEKTVTCDPGYSLLSCGIKVKILIL